MTTARNPPAPPDSWRNFLRLTVAWLMGAVTVVILSPLFLLAWLWSLADRLRSTASAPRDMKNLPSRHEASLR
jgi:hypothetical protein